MTYILKEHLEYINSILEEKLVIDVISHIYSYIFIKTALLIQRHVISMYENTYEYKDYIVYTLFWRLNRIDHREIKYPSTSMIDDDLEIKTIPPIEDIGEWHDELSTYYRKTENFAPRNWSYYLTYHIKNDFVHVFDEMYEEYHYDLYKKYVNANNYWRGAIKFKYTNASNTLILDEFMSDIFKWRYYIKKKFPSDIEEWKI